MENNRKKSFIVLAISFFLFSFFIAVLMNGSHWVSRLKESYFITVELKNNVDEERANALENKLLEQPEVKGVRYIAKDEAFRNLQKELGVVIPKSENALPNSLLVYFNSVDEIEKIQNLLEPEESIKEVFIDADFIAQIQKRVDTINSFSIFIIITNIAIAAMIYLNFKMAVENEYLRLTIVTPGHERNNLKAQNFNLLPFTGGTITGLLVFLNLYAIIRNKMMSFAPGIYLLTTNQLIWTLFGVLFLYNLIIWFTPVLMNRRKK
ncbi:cell division protein FtsX [Cetobacterium sp. SF1]|uniref:cell division protein FtsX n=1 Tax=unclassified Cetobacterium TaxID=2630983 RepID=UPI003CED0C98